MDIAALLAELTLEEKAALTCGADMWRTVAVDRLGIPAVMVSDGPHGLRTQLGEVSDLGGAEPATCFPTAVTLASSWDPELVREVGQAIGAQARDLGVGVVLGPGINIKRSPLCGRNFEYFSEDPLLAGELGLALVEGVQAQSVGTSLKHFAANNQETDRARVSAEVSMRALREIYLPAFERIVRDGRPWTVMCAYNTLNGVMVAENRWLLTEVLRDEWGFGGLVISDWGAVDRRVPSLAAGVDLEMPPDLDHSPAAVVSAVRSGELAEAVLDESVRRVLHLVERVTESWGGAEASEGAGQPGEAAGFEAHRALARRAAAESLVLLENDGVLPLADGARVAVVGRFAEVPRFQGDGSSRVNAEHTTSLLGAFAEAGVEVAYAPGFGEGAEQRGDEGAAASLRDEAVKASRDADVVVVMVGLTAAEESEGFDRTHLELPRDQVDCLLAVCRANPNVVVVVSHGGVVTMPWRGDVRALLDCGLAGQESGGAVFDVLTGAVNPSGRLAETVPNLLGDHPSYLSFPGADGHAVYAEDVFVGYRGFEATGRPPAYAFGHGLSYTRFAFGEVRVTHSGSVATGDLKVRVTAEVTNIGERAGKEVIQLFVHNPQRGRVKRPRRELRAFAKVSLEPGRTTTITFDLAERAFAYWATALDRFVVEAGAYALSLRGSTSWWTGEPFLLEAPELHAPLHRDSSVCEWLDHPQGRAELERELGVGPGGRLPGMLGNDEMLTLVGDFPLRRAVSQPKAPITAEQVHAMLGRLGFTGRPGRGTRQD